MNQNVITTEGIYKRGVIIPNIKPTGKRRALITFLPMNTVSRSDEDVWKEVRPLAKRVRKELFREAYPKLYAKLQKKSTGLR